MTKKRHSVLDTRERTPEETKAELEAKIFLNRIKALGDEAYELMSNEDLSQETFEWLDSVCEGFYGMVEDGQESLNRLFISVQQLLNMATHELPVTYQSMLMENKIRTGIMSPTKDLVLEFDGHTYKLLAGGEVILDSAITLHVQTCITDFFSETGAN